MAVWSAEVRNQKLLRLFLVATIVLGFVFLGIKSIEYTPEV